MPECPSVPNQARTSRRWSSLLLIILCVLAPLMIPIARAQVVPGARTDTESETRVPAATTKSRGHGWALWRETFDGPGGSRVVNRVIHLPPRVDSSNENRGDHRIVFEVNQDVDAIAWSAGRVWLVLEDELGPESRRQRRVLMGTVVPVGPGRFDYPPGRLLSLRSLDGDPDLIGVAAFSQRLVVLERERLRADDRHQPAIDLRVLWGMEFWCRALLPWELDSAVPGPPEWQLKTDRPVPELVTDGMIQLTKFRDGIALMVRRGSTGPADLWIGREPTYATSVATVHPLLVWERRSYSMQVLPTEGKLAPGGTFKPHDVIFVEGDRESSDTLLIVEKTDAGLRLFTAREAGLSPLSDLLFSEKAQLISMSAPEREDGGVGQIAALWWDVPKRESGPSDLRDQARPITTPRLFIKEVSALTGRVLYAGLAKSPGLNMTQQLQTMAVMLVLLAAGVLLFIIRPDVAKLPPLPENKSIADPTRRLFAFLIDYAPAAIAVSILTDRTPTALMNPFAMFSPETGITPILVVLGCCAVHCTITEWLFGRTLGKAITGCQVLGIRTGPSGTEPTYGRLKFWQALVRNLIRWSVPLVGILALFDQSRRHPADIAARTLVVSTAEDNF